MPPEDGSIVFTRWRQSSLPSSHVTHASSGPLKFTTQTASLSVQPFCTAQGRVTSGTLPSKFPSGICTPSNTWFLGSTRLSIPKGLSIGSAAFPQLMAESPGHVLSPKNCSVTLGDLDSYLTYGSLSPQPKHHLDRFSHLCTAHSRVSSGTHTPSMSSPLKIARLHGFLYPI